MGIRLLPSFQRERLKTRSSEDNLVGPHSTSVQAVCLSSSLGTHAYWNSIRCDPKLNDPKEKKLPGGIGWCLGWWDWIFYAFVQQIFQRAIMQNQVCSPYQTFSFLLPDIPPQNRDCHLITHFVGRCHCWTLPGSLILDMTCVVISCLDFCDRFFGGKNYTFLVIIMKASHVYCRNFRKKRDKLQLIILPSKTNIVILLDVSFCSFWYKCTHAHTQLFFFYKNWNTLYIFFNNLLFKTYIYILEYVIHTQIQIQKVHKAL